MIAFRGTAFNDKCLAKMCEPAGGEGGTISKESREERGRGTKERPSSGTVVCNKFISCIPTYNIYIQVTSQFFSKQRVETHFIDPKVHFDHFSGRKDKPDLKMKVSTSIERGTTCGFDMTVFPSSADHGSIPSLVLPTGGWRPTNVPLI